MKNNSVPSLSHKIIVCLLAGLTSGASFNRLAARLLGHWLPQALIDPLTVIIIIAPVVYAFVWQLKLKDLGETMPVLLFWQGVIRFAVAFDLSMFGWLKIFHLQFWVPMEMLDEPFGSISSQWLTWMYFARSYPMDFVIGAFQIAGSFLLLFSTTRLMGVFVIIPLLLNVFLIGVFYEMGLVVVHAGIMLAAIIYLLLSEYDRLKEFFLTSETKDKEIKINPGIKMGIRSLLLVVPMIFISTHETADKHPELKGKYEVEKIQINNTDHSASINCDSVLSVVYLEVGNTCVFQFKNYQQRLVGIYNYQRGHDQFNVEWLGQNATSKLEATLTTIGDKRMKLSGKLGQSILEAELLKVK